MTKYSGIFESPFGPIGIICSNDFVIEISWLNQRDVSISENRHSLVRSAATQLDEYFSGKRSSFDLPLFIDDSLFVKDPVFIDDPLFANDPRYKSFGGTPFQRRVWKALCDIPYGKTETYGQLANRIGCPGGARAVGSANAKNPVSIVVPCHRVIASGGRPGEISRKNLGGYSAFGNGPKSQKGLALKQNLLEHEMKNKQNNMR
ncbi:MAG TPA: methylated-DNA--[protein]-cysteine S-methyltransferase [Bacillota bacterium]|mgnify:CR=1 FL=1|nr:methylated-DNA--[protein]-cysteine S-methyltransferase [Bacillota bacterium]HUM55888.1 methylated-DNA--[protein]-cysteine S-methyltransferase [Bacillota bacterium]